jgi:hypothetical protein
MLTQPVIIEFNRFMDLVRNNVPNMTDIKNLNNVRRKLIIKRRQMDKELNTLSMNQSQKTTYEAYIAELNEMINLTEAKIDDVRGPLAGAGGRRKRKSIKKRKSSRRKRLSRRRYI